MSCSAGNDVTPAVACDVGHNADAGQDDDETGAAERHERQRHAGEWQDAQSGADIDRGLHADGAADTGGEQLAVRLAAAQRDAEDRPHERHVEGDQHEQPDEAELLADDTRDGVGSLFGQKAELLDGVAQTQAEQVTRSDRDERLHGLHARAAGVFPRVHKRGEARHAVGLDHDGRGDAGRGDGAECDQMAHARPGRHDDRHDGQHEDDGRAQVGLGHDQHRRRRDAQGDEAHEAAGAEHFGRALDDEAGHEHDARQLGELARRVRKARHDDPAAGAVDLGADARHQHDQQAE
jgi:hypothetical protein